MKQLKQYTIVGVFFVLIAGTLSHFLYDWTNNSLLAGFFTPVNESVWEHMKLIYFPMLLYSLFMVLKFVKRCPAVISAFSFGILLGTLLIPVIFYIYTGILGHNVFLLDFFTFTGSVVAAFYSSYRLTLSERLRHVSPLLCGLTCVLAICLLLFTYCPPDIELFAEPSF